MEQFTRKGSVLVGLCALALLTRGVAAQTPLDLYACQGIGPSMEGDSQGDHVGFEMASGGDWDGDGFDDLLFSSSIAAGNGEIWLYHGTALGSVVKFRLSPFDNDEFGTAPAVAFLGDVDGGGLDDIAIGDPYWTNGATGVYAAGRVYVLLGESAGSLVPDANGEVVLDADACQADYVIEWDVAPYPGQIEVQAMFGWALDGANIGYSADEPIKLPAPAQQWADLVVGAPAHPDHVVGQDLVTGDDLYDEGRIYALFGGPHDPGNGVYAFVGACAPLSVGSNCSGVKPVRLSATCASLTPGGHASRDRFGFSVARVGDLFPSGGDGYDEFVVGAPEATFGNGGLSPFVEPFHDAAGVRRTGYAQVWTFAHSSLDEVDSTPAAGHEVAAFGWSVSTGGDITGDGVPEVLVGAPGYTRRVGTRRLDPLVDFVDIGAAYVYSGVAGVNGDLPLLTPAPITLETLVNVTETVQSGELFGFSVGGMDHPQLASDRFLVGAPRRWGPVDPGNLCSCSVTGGELSGMAYGLALAWSGSVWDPVAERRYTGETARDGHGWRVVLGEVEHGVRPVNSYPDHIVSSPRTATDCTNDGTEEGEVYIYAGEP